LDEWDNMKQTPLEQKIYDIATPPAQDMGLRVHHVQVSGATGSLTVQIMAENPETRNIGADECAQLSRSVSALMDVEDPIDGAYRLEVSSPGIDRLLMNEHDFEEFTGFDAKLETDMPLENGQKKFRGVLKGIENGDITIATDQGEFLVPFGMLKKAKLVLTDELIKASRPKAAQK